MSKKERIAELERRLAQLEAEIAILRQQQIQIIPSPPVNPFLPYPNLPHTQPWITWTAPDTTDYRTVSINCHGGKA